MNKYYLLFVVALFCSCATTLKLENTVWYNVTPAEKDGVKADVYTTLYFGEDDVVNINTSVRQGATMIVAPCFTAYGTYSYSGKIRKGIEVHIKGIDADNMPVSYDGIIYKKGMVLVSQDSIAQGYKMAENLRLK
ncbi:MAG: hypothetical protein IJ169_08350 [Paludibacteraceae bacterium]|nr:hypothetical protein [Paludibacteraceae bacterium]